MVQAKKQNYLNNKDLLKEIHKSKMTYCYVADDKYASFDVILEDVKKINRNRLLSSKIITRKGYVLNFIPKTNRYFVIR